MTSNDSRHNKKRFTIKTEDTQDAALRALAEGENGADLRVLELLATLVLANLEINPDFQRIANAIVAQSVLLGKLPSKPRGRPKDENNDVSRDVSDDYYDMRDAGVSYAEAVAQLTEKYHKDERHIMRLVKLGKRGVTRADREFLREFWRTIPTDYAPILKQISEMRYVNDRMREELMQRDFIGELDDLIDAELDRKTFPDKKSFGFIASD